jgi:hypothetical protein
MTVSVAGANRLAPSRLEVTADRIPLSFFGMPVGLAGLAGTWVTLAPYHHAPAWAGNTLLVLAGLVWTVIVCLPGGRHRHAAGRRDRRPDTGRCCSHTAPCARRPPSRKAWPSRQHSSEPNPSAPANLNVKETLDVVLK